MGLIIEFYAGNADEIGKLYIDIDWEPLRNGTVAKANADFSLHLSPADLDSLSIVIAKHVGSSQIGLNDCLIRCVGSTKNECSADVVDPTWVQMIARANSEHAWLIASDWAEVLTKEYGSHIEPNKEIEAAIRDLINLCKKAVQDKIDVVFTWSL